MKEPVTSKNNEPGLLITLEGPEGSGKSTLIRALAEHLRDQGVEPLLLREPGGTPIGEQIRNILLDLSSEGMCAETELLLMVASRAQLIRQEVEPALATGRMIICDRFADASVAYQGFGRELGADTINQLNRVALAGIKPDLTFLCMLPPQEGQRRIVRRGTDRLDREATEFHSRVYSGYQSMVASDDPRFRVIDALDTPSEMLRAVVTQLKTLEHSLLKGL